MRTKKVKSMLPDALVEIADSFTTLAKKYEEAPVEKTAPGTGWEFDEELPPAIEDWTDKDFVAFFKRECLRVDQPLVVSWQRDVSAFKNLKVDLMSAGYVEKKEWKRFIEWCFENRSSFLDSDNRFNLTSIRQHLNDYLQTLHRSDVEKEVVKLGFDIRKRMIQEANAGHDAAQLLFQYGIPLVAAFFKKERRLSEDDLLKGIRGIVKKLFSKSDGDALLKVGKASIIMSPYPEWFPLLSWRELLPDLANACKQQGWYREKDSIGKCFEEYDEFRP